MFRNGKILNMYNGEYRFWQAHLGLRKRTDVLVTCTSAYHLLFPENQLIFTHDPDESIQSYLSKNIDDEKRCWVPTDQSVSRTTSTMLMSELFIATEMRCFGQLCPLYTKNLIENYGTFVLMAIEYTSRL